MQSPAAGRQQVSASSASGAGIGEGAGPPMPALESRADEPSRAEAASEAAASFLSSHVHQPAADSGVLEENSDDLPDYESD